jgi:signal transduction histidine kinase
VEPPACCRPPSSGWARWPRPSAGSSPCSWPPSDLLRAGADECLTDKQRGYLTRVQDSAARMKALIDDLLAFASADSSSLRFADIDLNHLVENVLAERLGQDTTTVTPRIDCAKLPVVKGDPSQLRQVLDNLIGNAIKYTPEGADPEISIAARDGDGECRIEVADHGIGIPEKQLGEVFNGFTRAEGSERYPGTGLGLAIVQRIVERHGGTVGVEPNTGGGSRFWFTLPTT